MDNSIVFSPSKSIFVGGMLWGFVPKGWYYQIRYQKTGTPATPTIQYPKKLTIG